MKAKHGAQQRVPSSAGALEKIRDSNGTFIPEVAEMAPEGDRRMGANANGGHLLKDLVMPDFPVELG